MVPTATIAAPAARKRKAGERGPEIAILARVQARNLYLNECLPYALISTKTGIPVRSLHAMACREGWTGIRAEQKKRLIAKADARGAAMHEQVIDAITSVSEQHAIRGLDRVGEALERDDKDAAKDFQALTAGVKNLVGVVHLLRTPAGGSEASAASVLNVYLLRAGDVAADAKAVTEISAKPVQ